MQPTIQIPQLPQLKSDGTFDTPAVQRFFEDIQKTLQSKQLDDYNNSSITESGGSGANRYIKFRDGTLIQWCDVVVAHETITNRNIGTYGWSYYGGSTTKTFPIPFIDNNYDVIGTSNYNRCVCAVQKTSVSQCTVLLLSPASDSSPISVIAIGRWK